MVTRVQLSMMTRVQSVLVSLVVLAACGGRSASVREPAHVQASDVNHDFDFHIGTWATHVRYRQHALTGEETWVEYDGTTIVRSVWNGRANLVELSCDGAAGHLELLSLRLFQPETGTWTLHVGNAQDGSMSTPSVGKFEAGRGVFVSREVRDGRDVIVRFTISDITQTSIHFEQALSVDEGKTWVVNWLATDTRRGKS